MKIFILAAAAMVCTCLSFGQVADYKRIHFDALVVDTHNDVVQRMLGGEDISKLTHHGQSDLPRWKEGGLDVQMFSIWVPPEQTKKSYYAQSDEQIDSVESLARRTPDRVGMAYSTKDIQRLVKEGKFAAMLGMEGGHPIDNDLKKLEHFYKRGVRYMTLTWNNSLDWATSAKDETDPEAKLPHKGLTQFGKKVVKKMNELGMMVDISHVGEQTFWDVLKVTRKPVIASHSSAWALCHHRRNLKDEQLKAIKKNGGVVFINFYPAFIDSTFNRKEQAMQEQNKAKIDSLNKAVKVEGFLQGQYVAELMKDDYEPFRPPLSTLVDHFDYVAKLIGVDHVGIGSDFDGIEVAPKDMDDVTHYPNITRELLKRGYSESDVKKILGGNFMRVLKEVEKH
ncbi:MAG TPA: dipeptidase [Bacteroidota bacterium]|jgi:membrane dipeptidase|nr:dipeptidase [Bacteroidota bacterium]